jgi:hypothetical protein
LSAALDGSGVVRGVKPRVRRRLAWLLGTIVALAVAGGALYHVLGPTGSTDTRKSPPRRQTEVGEQNGGIAYGDTAKQVLTKLGSPTQKQAACWIYDAHLHTINGMYLGKVIDAMKFCFAEGPLGGNVVSTIYEHFIPSVTASLPKDKRPPGGWIHAFNFASPGSEHLKF